MLARLKLAPLFASSIASAFFVATACAGGATAPLGEEGSALAEDGTQGGAIGTQDHRPPPPPRPCEADADCAQACPPGSLGCACAATPHGHKVCVPTCGTDADCPSPPDGTKLACDEGMCHPTSPPPGPRPKACAAEQDCQGACPGAKGCTCHTTPHGEKLCIPTCGSDADCPRGPDGAPPMKCDEGVCKPPRR